MKTVEITESKKSYIAPVIDSILIVTETSFMSGPIDSGDQDGDDMGEL